MSGDPESGDGDAPRPRVSLFGRATKPTLNDPAPPPAKPPRKPRRMGLSSLSGLLTFVLLGALATVGGLVWLMKEARSPGPLTEDKVVMIMREDDAADIADQLERAGVIDSATWFNILTALDGNRGALKRGEYAFKAGMSMNDIENELIAHRVIRYKITIPEGLTSEQVVDRLHEDTCFDRRHQRAPARGFADARYLLFRTGRHAAVDSLAHGEDSDEGGRGHMENALAGFADQVAMGNGDPRLDRRERDGQDRKSGRA